MVLDTHPEEMVSLIPLRPNNVEMCAELALGKVEIAVNGLIRFNLSL